MGTKFLVIFFLFAQTAWGQDDSLKPSKINSDKLVGLWVFNDGGMPSIFFLKFKADKTFFEKRRLKFGFTEYIETGKWSVKNDTLILNFQYTRKNLFHKKRPMTEHSSPWKVILLNGELCFTWDDRGDETGIGRCYRRKDK